MSNILKGFYTNQTEERVIDYNEVISDKIESFKKKMMKQRVEADGFVNGLEAEIVEGLIGEGLQRPEVESVATMESDLSVETENIEVTGERMFDSEEIKNFANDVVANANREAEEILANANKEAEEIKNRVYAQALEEGKKKGYEQGSMMAEVDFQARVQQLDAKLEAVKLEYADKYKTMEQEIVSTLIEVFEKVTHTIAEDNKDIVLHLINNVMDNIDFSGDFFIRVSKEDYPFLIENQGKIYCASSKDINISIMEDSTVTKNQCIIETDGGVFDCSLDIQLEQLIRDIKLLSCI